MKVLILFFSCIFIIHSNSISQPVDVELRRIHGQGNGGIILELKPAMYDSILFSPDSYYPHPVYQAESGPVDIHIYNAQICPEGLFSLSITGISDTSKWTLYSHSQDITIQSNSTIYTDYEQDIPQWGILVRSRSVENPGEIENSVNNGYLQSKIIYEDSSIQWLNFVTDLDVYSSINWIRSGHLLDYGNPEFNDWNMPVKAYDFYEAYENVLFGSWSPYLLVASQSQDIGGPAISIDSKIKNDFQKLASVDLMITDDKTKWTRCCVIEMSNDSLLAQGFAQPFSLRNHPSVNVDGDTGVIHTNPLYQSDFISSIGMGWFPGYAINVETGERLNILFGENSWLNDDNGRDLIWNPTNNILEPPSLNPIFGGFHNVYIMGAVCVDTFNFPRYDKGQYIHNLLLEDQNNINKDFIFASTYWVGIPLSTNPATWLNNNVKIKLRISKKYDYFNNTDLPKYTFRNGTTSIDELNAIHVKVFPNPASNKINIIVSDTIVRNELDISIYNISGERLHHTTRSSTNKIIDLDISGLSGGNYILAISGENFKVVRKLIINK